jgi:hypothetical protein
VNGLYQFGLARQPAKRLRARVWVLATFDRHGVGAAPDGHAPARPGVIAGDLLDGPFKQQPGLLLDGIGRWFGAADQDQVGDVAEVVHAGDGSKVPQRHAGRQRLAFELAFD